MSNEKQDRDVTFAAWLFFGLYSGGWVILLILALTGQIIDDRTGLPVKIEAIACVLVGWFFLYVVPTAYIVYRIFFQKNAEPVQMEMDELLEDDRPGSHDH